MDILMPTINNDRDLTLKELTKIFTDNGLEYFVKQGKGTVVQIHFIVKTDE